KGAEPLRVLMREMQNDASADRATDGYRPVEFERVGDLDDHSHIVARGELVISILPSGRRGGLAMPRHVESDDAEIFRPARIVEHAAILARVGTCSMQAQQRNALPGFLHIEAVGVSQGLNVQIEARDQPPT